MFGLILLGSAGKANTVGTGQFYCPRCQTLRPYAHKKLARYFTLYFVPIFPIEQQGEFIECQVCHTAFDMAVLQPSGPARIALLMQGLDAQLKAGHSVQLLVDHMLQAGASREEAAWAVYSVERGQFARCENCGTMYDRSLAFCSQCGHKLTPFQGQPE
jgi:zinc-ribbon family